MVQILSLAVGELGANCYVLYEQGGAVGAVVDPGADASRILATVQQHGLTIDKIVLTHGHADHLGAADELRRGTGARVYIHQADGKMAASEQLNLSSWIGPFGFALEVDELLAAGQTLSLGGVEFRVIHTPGHSPGSICLYSRESTAVLSGDTLFAGGVGRTDLFGGSSRQLQNSVANLLAELPGETIVYPGHGGKTSIRAEQGVLQLFS